MSFALDLADIHAAFAEMVLYTGAGLSAGSVAAIAYQDSAPDFQGGGRSVQHVWFEVQQDALPEAPARGDVIEKGGEHWSVIDVVDRAEVGAWQLSVERLYA